MTIPTILHADVSLNERNRAVIRMHEGYSFYDRQSYDGIETDEITLSKYAVFAPDTDFDARIVVVSDSGEDVTDGDKATEADYINALEELGVSFDE